MPFSFCASFLYTCFITWSFLQKIMSLFRLILKVVCHIQGIPAHTFPGAQPHKPIYAAPTSWPTFTNTVTHTNTGKHPDLRRPLSDKGQCFKGLGVLEIKGFQSRGQSPLLGQCTLYEANAHCPSDMTASTLFNTSYAILFPLVRNGWHQATLLKHSTMLTYLLSDRRHAPRPRSGTLWKDTKPLMPDGKPSGVPRDEVDSSIKPRDIHLPLLPSCSTFLMGLGRVPLAPNKPTSSFLLGVEYWVDWKCWLLWSIGWDLNHIWDIYFYL